MQSNRENARSKTEALLREGFLSSGIDERVQVGEPLAVMFPNGAQHSWFVPLVAGERLVGFAQLLTSLVPLRVSSFQRHPQDYDHCPDLADWIDLERIAARAASLARQGERLSAPTLSFDGNPDRLAWRVEAKSSSGKTRRLFVAGTAVYEDRGTQGLG
jgi:hypothetical protein